MAYSPDRKKHVEHQLLDATEYLIANGITANLGSAIVNVDMAQVDVEGITGGAAGVPGTGGKTLKDINTTLNSPAQAGEAAAATAGLALNTTLGSPAQAGEAGTAAGVIVSALGSVAQAGEAAAAGASLEALMEIFFDLFTGGGSDFIGMPELKANLDAKLDTLHTDIEALEVAVAANSALLSFDVLAGPNEVTVDNTATGKTLETLLGVALNAGLRRLTLVVQGTISWAAGSATVGVNNLVPGVYMLDVSKAVADTFKFIASANTAVTVLQEG